VASIRSPIPTTHRQEECHFDFDSFNREERIPAAGRSARRYLAANAGRQIKIEGTSTNAAGANTTWRWARSAEAVKQRLLLMGARDGQIETV
jgi:hypothetical protein